MIFPASIRWSLVPRRFQNQTQWAEQQIKEEFEQLRQFLQTEEDGRLAALREEHDRKWQRVKGKTDGLTRDILSLSHTIIAIDSEVAAGDGLFLQVMQQPTGRMTV